MPLVKGVNAKVLEADARLIRRRLKRTGFPSMLIRSFMANLTALSIKMQKAQDYDEIIDFVDEV